jgi:hypothetical protein
LPNQRFASTRERSQHDNKRELVMAFSFHRDFLYSGRMEIGLRYRDICQNLLYRNVCTNIIQ